MLPGIARLRGVEAIGALLDASHFSLAGHLAAFRDRDLADADPDGDDEARAHAKTLLQRMAEAGVAGAVDCRDLRAFCLTREAVAFASPLADAVLAIQALVATALRLASDGRHPALESVTSGRAMAAFAMTEPAAGSDVASMQTTARRDGETWILNGEKHLISNAGIADIYFVFAVTAPGQGSRGISAFLVPSDATGLSFSRQAMSAPHPLGRVVLQDCRVPADALVGAEHRGFSLGMATLDRVRPSVGAAACGMAARALCEALQHAASRQQFGNPLASYQIIREKTGRLAAALEAARLLVYRAAWHGDRSTERITLEAAMAKSVATETAQEVVDEAVQITGGAGTLLGHPVERLYRAIRALRIYEGTTEIQRLIIANELFGKA
jgi:acyl-CoA dehydrogenase